MLAMGFVEVQLFPYAYIGNPQTMEIDKNSPPPYDGSDTSDKKDILPKDDDNEVKEPQRGRLCS